jgi:hypothetical protein
MIRIDSLKFKFPNNFINTKNNSLELENNLFPVLLKTKNKINNSDDKWSKYYEEIQELKTRGSISYNPRTGEIKNECLIYNKPNAIGLKSINVGTNETIIELSAKILKENYYDLINYKNFDKVIEEINNSGEIEIDPILVKRTGEVLKVDITNNIELQNSKTVLETVRDLGNLATGRKYRVTNYEGGYEIVSQNKTDRERLIIYPKLTELLSQKKINKDLKNSGCDFSKFNNTLRIESNFKNFNSMRKYFYPEQGKLLRMSKKDLTLEIPGKFRIAKNSLYRLESDYVYVIENKKPLMLNDIFSSEKNINYLKVQAMYGDLSSNQDLSIQAIIDHLDKVYKIEKFIGQINIIKFYNYDIHLIRKFLKSKMGSGSNISSYIRQYEDKIRFLKQAELNNKNHIEIFFNKLKEAA